MSNKEVFITTIDNPYDYFTQFDEWLNFDRLKGYYTLEYLARLVHTAPDLSDEEERNEIERAIDSIIEWNGKLYKKIYSS
jgi:hypothetical protein